MREVLKSLNKRIVAEETGISYKRLRNYCSGAIQKLTKEEIQKIYKFLISLSEKFII